MTRDPFIPDDAYDEELDCAECGGPVFRGEDCQKCGEHCPSEREIEDDCTGDDSDWRGDDY